MNPKTEALKARTKKFVLDVLDFVETLPTHGPSVRIGNQLIDAGTSVGANYRASCRARSKAEFAAKIGLVLEEADESLFWLELTAARSLGSTLLRDPLLQEAHELTAIFAASSITTRESLSTGRR
jgi:four helix bundle protein